MQLPLAPISINNIPHQEVLQLIYTISRVPLFICSEPSLPSSYAIPRFWIRRLSEKAGCAPLLCVVPHLRDLCCILFSSVLSAHVHITSPVLGPEIYPCGNSHLCVPCSIPTAQKSGYSTAVQETEGSCGTVNDIALNPLLPAPLHCLALVMVFLSIFCLQHQFNLISAHEQEKFSSQTGTRSQTVFLVRPK